MGAAGRNDQCGCGSGRKAKRCCGVRRGPSEADLARAFVASQVPAAARILRRCSDEELDDLGAEMLRLPALDTSLQLPLPRLVTPDVDRLLLAIEDGDFGSAEAALPAVLARVDTPMARADLARAVLRLRDQGRVDSKVAALAMFELSDPKLRGLVSAALLEAACVLAGETATPGGLLIAG